MAIVLLGARGAEAATAEKTPLVSNQPVLFVADEVQYDNDLGLVVATGHVQLSQKDQILLADNVTYNQKTDTVTATGHVSLLEPSGDVTFADFVELHDDMREGFIKNIRALLSDRSRLAGNTARRVEGNRTEIRRAVYSPCDLCESDPTRPPIWQIKAEKVIHDKEAQVVEYRDASIDIAGVPVFWTPYFSHPDPSVKRQSGFLAPTAGYSTTLGAHTTTPYFWAISPDKDATFAPMFTTDAGFIMSGEYRQAFTDGYVRAAGSVAYTNQENSTGTAITPINTVRGHFFTNGGYDFNDTWRSTWDINRTSDATYLQRFRFGGGFGTTFGAYSAQPYLQSRADVESFFDSRSYGIVDNYMFQSLRFGIGESTQPVVLPVATYNWVGHPDEWGGRWTATSNVENLITPANSGVQIRRLSTGAGWSIPLNGLVGDRFNFSANLRGDAYQSQNVVLATGQGPSDSETAGRIYPQTELLWRYPWVRRGNGYNQTIEPIVAVIASTNGGNPATIPAEDSPAFEFDETSLFVPNRFPGYDRVDSGQRVDYGLQGAFYGDGGGSSQFLVGQSYRFQGNGPYPVGSGVNTRRSDIVGRVIVTPAPFLDLIYRFRLDEKHLTSRRQEVGVYTGPPSLRLGLNFLSIKQDPLVPDLEERKQISATLNADLTRYWSLQLLGTRDLGSSSIVNNNGFSVTTGVSETVASGVAAVYQDECMVFRTSFTYSGTRAGDIHPGSTILFTIGLKNLGEINAPVFSSSSGNSGTNTFGGLGGLGSAASSAF